MSSHIVFSTRRAPPEAGSKPRIFYWSGWGMWCCAAILGTTCYRSGFGGTPKSAYDNWHRKQGA